MVKKIHTRLKRKHNLTSSFGHKKFFSGYKKPHRPKTFNTKEAAIEYAEKQGLKKDQYILSPAKKNKKIKIELV